MVSSIETGRCDSFFGQHAEFDMVKQHVQCRLILEIAPGNTDRDDRLAIFQDERWRQRDAGTFAGLDTVRMSGRSVQAANAISLRDTRWPRFVAGKITTGRRGYDITPTIRHDTCRGVLHRNVGLRIVQIVIALERSRTIRISRPASKRWVP